MNAHETLGALDQITNLAAAIILEDAQAHEAKRNHSAFAPRVQALIEHHLATKNVLMPVEAVASALAVSGPTLRRYLQTEETSYQKIVDAAREKIVKTLLTESNMNTDDIGAAVGFSGGTGLARAFKDWTGTTLTDYRVQFGDPEKTGKLRRNGTRRGRPPKSIAPPAMTASTEEKKPTRSLFDGAPEPAPLEEVKPEASVLANAPAVIETAAAVEEESEQEFIPAEHVVSYREQKNDHWQAVRSVQLFLNAYRPHH